eukprot:TRINITY_DN608_c0_g1_i1.p1 TRINITY_DN608_c0_g1~~TRINITY_DN608_c0_g1_i1.p1  ORF type:complete len:426 (+),score=35.46 TRINITY_DN608_c0_g1_i1:186-1280(+)
MKLRVFHSLAIWATLILISSAAMDENETHTITPITQTPAYVYVPKSITSAESRSGCVGGQCVSTSVVSCAACTPSLRQTCASGLCGYDVTVTCPGCSSFATDAGALACCTTCRQNIAAPTSDYAALDITTRQALVNNLVCSLPNGTSVVAPGGTVVVLDSTGSVVAPLYPTAPRAYGPCTTTCDAVRDCPLGLRCLCESCGSTRQTSVRLVIASEEECWSQACCDAWAAYVPCGWRSTCTCPVFGAGYVCPACGSSKKGLYGLLALLALVPLILCSLVIALCCLLRPTKTGKGVPVATFQPNPNGMPLPPGMHPSMASPGMHPSMASPGHPGGFGPPDFGSQSICTNAPPFGAMTQTPGASMML